MRQAISLKVGESRLISLNEFKRRVGREKLVVFDDFVLEVASYMDSHPGGKYLLEANIGRDISKFFYGAYALNKSFAAFNHHSNSNYALLNSLRIGRLTLNT